MDRRKFCRGLGIGAVATGAPVMAAAIALTVPRLRSLPAVPRDEQIGREAWDALVERVNVLSQDAC
jgi:hypothetical protein